MVIRGGPGTGKTLLAAEMCRRLRARGRSPVYLCFTSALAAALRSSGLEHAFTVRELAIDLLGRLGIPVGEGAPQSAWSAETWERASTLASERAAPLARQQFDAVVVDEAQGLSTADWDFLRAMAEGRPLYAYGVSAPDIAVVSLAGQTKTALCARSELGNIPVRRADAPDASEHVVADTFLRFKGLERPWILVAELGLGATRYEIRMHVALTRATVGCVVVATEEEVGRDEGLRSG